MKKNNLFTLSLLALFGAGFYIQADAFALSATFDQKITTQQGNVVAVIKVTVKDKNVRAESTFGGNASVIIRNDKGTFNYLPSQNVATQIPQEAEQRDPVNDLSDFMSFLTRNNAKLIKSENVGGKDCDVYQFADPTTGADSKAWVWKEKKFPIRIQVATTVGATTIDFENIQLDPKIDPSVFQLPPNAQILKLDMTKAPGAGAAAAPQGPAKS